MKFKLTPPPSEGTRRTRRVIAWFPTFCEDDADKVVVWLQRYNKQEIWEFRMFQGGWDWYHERAWL